ncbi:MAG: hypothetical protein LBL90_11500 [Prevotellaceae bacterium]|jgi:hypothetical protein|nr:hypothetical protein [Prevotellaceae bacterium]
MKKLKILFLFFALIPVLALTSCSDNGEDPIPLKTGIVAKWSYSDLKLDVNAPSLGAMGSSAVLTPLIKAFLGDKLPFVEKSVTEFKSDGSIVVTKESTTLASGTYIADDTSVTTTFEGIFTKYDATIIGNKLTMSLDKTFLSTLIDSLSDEMFEGLPFTKEQIKTALSATDTIFKLEIIFTKA